MTDTSAAQARKGKDIQGIPWDRLNITREGYRRTRLEQYRNYENVPASGDVMEKVSLFPFPIPCIYFFTYAGAIKLLSSISVDLHLLLQECKQVEKCGNYYEFRHNARSVKSTILHFQVTVFFMSCIFSLFI